MKLKRTAAIVAGLMIVNFGANAENLILPKEALEEASPSWILSKSSLSDKYVRINVESAFVDVALDYFNSIGYVVEFDNLTKIKSSVVTDSSHSAYSARESSFSFNDPLFDGQSGFYSSLNSIAEGMEYQRDRNREINVVVMDTGSLPHEDVAFSGGFNYATQFEDPQRDPANYEDLTSIYEENEEGNLVLQSTCSSGHGLEMSGIIGAEQNNNIGIAGIADVNLYMARVVETDCSTGDDVGQLSDLYVALEDISRAGGAGGIPVPDVVNISLVSETTCPNYLQEAIDDLVDVGATIVVSAGNQGEQAGAYAPANCQNVVVAGAHDNDGNLSSFSNRGIPLDVTSREAFLTTISDGGYGLTTGTSGAAASVTGMVSVVKQMFPDITPSDVEYVLRESAVHYDASSNCSGVGCGEGTANLKNTLQAAEKIIDPKLSFNHPLHSEGQCLVDREAEGLAELIDVCATFELNVKTTYSSVEKPVEYSIDILRRPVGIQSWESGSVEVVDSFSPEGNEDGTPLLSVDPGMYEYGVVSCFETTEGERRCPTVIEFDYDGTGKPSFCP